MCQQLLGSLVANALLAVDVRVRHILDKEIFEERNLSLVPIVVELLGVLVVAIGDDEHWVVLCHLVSL